MPIWIFVLVLVSGLGLPVQDALNSQLRGAVKSPMLSALISATFGAVALLVLSFTGLLGRGKIAEALHAPWYMVAGGGLLSAFAVIVGLMAIPRLSAGVTITATVCGELVAAVVIDHFGWLGVPQVRLNAWRVTGGVLLVVAALLMQHK